MRRSLVLVVLFASLLVGAHSAQGQPNPCGIPSYNTLWIDYADSSVPFWQTIFARPGVIGAASNQAVPPQLRAHGAISVYWDMYLNNRVGTPSAPADSSTIVARANRLFDYAVASTGCTTPWIAENELFGAGLTTPWSATNIQYRANVLLYLQTLAQRGARPFLLVNSTPYTDGPAGDWWRQVAQVADIVREDYFPAPKIFELGPLVGPRTLRIAYRQSIADFTALGIPPSKLGIMLGFQTQRGQGGREGLEPREAWYDTIKWQALAARQAAEDTRIATIWSWGWASWGQRDLDPDKQAGACVYLWTRAPALCPDALAQAGKAFDASRSQGLINLPAGIQCVINGRRIGQGELGPLQQLTGDREIAYTALLQRAAEAPYPGVSQREVLAAERAVIADRFGGSRGAYLAALSQAHATLAVARGVIADQLQRVKIESTLWAPSPSASDIATFYLGYPDLLARRVQAEPAPWWLGGRTRGFALSQLAPDRLFDLATGGRATLATMDGSFAVKALGDATQLGALPLDQARPAIAAALKAFARGEAFERWTVDKETAALNTATCLRDDLPQPGAVDLSTFLPFLALTD